MEFRDTLLAAQRNQQHKSSQNVYYKARFDPPKKAKEEKPKDRLSANIQKFLAKKEEEERLKQLDTKRKRDELLAMRDPKALRKIQKTLKVIKSANKSVIADAIDNDNTAVTLDGPQQPDQDDYGYESQEAAAIYQKMMEKYSKIPDEPKFPVANNSVKRDIEGTRQRVKYALQHVDDPVPHKRRRKTTQDEDRELSPPPKFETERRKEEKQKIRRAMPPPMDFNQLLKLAEQKKSEPVEAIVQKKVTTDIETERPMTKKQKREYEEEMARRMRRQQEIERAAERKGNKEIRSAQDKETKSTQDRDRKSQTFTKIPKLSDRESSNNKNFRSPDDYHKSSDRLDFKDKQRTEREKCVTDRDKVDKLNKDKLDRERAKIDRIRLLNKERAMNKDKQNNNDKVDNDRLDRIKMKHELNQLDSRKFNKTVCYNNKMVDGIRDRGNSSKDQVTKQDTKQSIDLKSQNTYRIDKNSNERKFVNTNRNGETKYMNGHSAQGKLLPKQNQMMRDGRMRREDKDKILQAKQKVLFRANDSPRPNGNIKPDSEKYSKSGNGRVEQNKNVPSKSKTDDRKQALQNGRKPQPSSSKPNVSNSFDFDKHVNSLGKANVRKADGSRQFPPSDGKRKQMPDDARQKTLQKRRVLDSDEENDSDMDDFIDDGDEEMDYSAHIKEIFGYDKSKYKHLDDDDDPDMESSFARQMREEFVSKKFGIMEDLEDMRMEAMEKKMKSKKRRRIDD